MKSLPRIIMALAALSLLLLFVMPLWKISLYAPQYPGGLGMFIWIDKITGSEPGTLQNINILNHYIGMKEIAFDAIPELKYFPKVILAMIGLGLISAFSGNRWVFLSWTILLMLLCIAGIYDFYLWEYNYGHNLADNAPIKIEGMVYQPPLFGRKELLNFIATSYPQGGGYALLLPIILGFTAFFIKKKNV